VSGSSHDPLNGTEDTSRPSEAPPHPGSPDPLRRSRTSGAWLGVVVFGLALLLLIIFIAQNTQSVDVAFLGWQGGVPLAVAVLVAALAGLLVAVTAGSLRIWQLRRRVRRTERGN
jgi:lipopolysaccharide assembly protein A